MAKNKVLKVIEDLWDKCNTDPLYSAETFFADVGFHLGRIDEAELSATVWKKTP